MDRRQALRAMGASATLAGLSPAQLSALTRLGRPTPMARAFFTVEQRETVEAMAEAIIPETDTPGAGDAGVTDFIEIIVSEWYDPDQRQHFMRGLSRVDERSVALSGLRFPVAGEEDQTAVLSGLEAEGSLSLESAEASGAELLTPFFHQFRSLVLHGYYNSEAGMRDGLMFRRLPGSFEGCVDLSRVARPVEIDHG